ncbi:Odorant receptor 55a [Blattella germanica]|nr:Odorant receptor 55a [Blattella germanica]
MRQGKCQDMIYYELCCCSDMRKYFCSTTMNSDSELSDFEIENNVRNCMNLLVKLLKIGGLWCTEKSGYTLNFFYNKIVIILIYIHGVAVFMKLYESRNNFDELLEVMSVSISVSMYFLKVNAFIFKKTEIEHILQNVKENLFIHKNKLMIENKKIIMSIIKHGRKITVIYMSWNLTINILYTLVSPLLAPIPETVNATDFVRPLAMKLWTPFDQTVSPNHEIMTAYVSIAGILHGFNFFVTDLFIMIMMVYCSGQFVLLCDSLFETTANVKKMILDDQNKSFNQPTLNVSLKKQKRKGEQEVKMEENMSSTLSTKLMHSETEKYLMDCIRHHQSLIEFAARVEDLWKTYFFAQFLTASFLICFLGYKSMTMDMDVNLLKNMGYLGSVIFQLALQCLFGSNLMTESSAVYDAVYSSDWYNQSNKYKFCSRMMIMRAQKPVQIRAGRFGIMSLPLFASMMRSSYSYLALLKQMQEE